MPTKQPVMWDLIRHRLPKGEWVGLQDIYNLIKKEIVLVSDDFEPTAATTTTPRWQRNVRNILQHRKDKEIVWSGDARYMIPLTTDQTVMTSSVPIKSGLGEEDFRKLQERKYEIGQLGEKYIVKYERQNLIKAGRNDLADKVRRISEEDIGAGYDILSFDINGESKYIEVKTTTGTGSTFELTANELHTAEKFGQQYWLYFVRDIGGTPQVTKILNPADKIGKLINIQPTAYTVRLIE